MPPRGYEQLILVRNKWTHSTSSGPGTMTGKVVGEKEAMPFGPKYDLFMSAILKDLEDYCKRNNAKIVDKERFNGCDFYLLELIE